MKVVLISLVTLFSVTGTAAETWVNNSLGSAPVFTGYEAGKANYVCRASGIVGKFIASDKKCYIPYYGKELTYTQYQVLQDPARRMRWLYMNNASDSKLVFGGWENGKGLWICRHVSGNLVISGKLVAGDEPYSIIKGGKCYYSYYGKEYSTTSYDVLTY
jgi:hypothetical protein